MHRTSRARRLTPSELAEAVVLADLALALTVVGQVIPLGGALILTAVVPMAVINARHRLRAVVVGAIAAAAVGFLVIGTAALTTMAGCAAFGALVGAADRRGWGRGRTIVVGTALLWPPIALIVDLVLFVFSDLRKLTLDQIRNSWRGLFHLIGNIGLTGVADAGDTAITWIVRNWWLSIPIFLFFAVIFGVWVSQGIATPTLRRVRSAFGPPATTPEPDHAGASAPLPSPAPLPAALDAVTYRYPNAPDDALAEVTARVEPGEFVVIVGRNGSGKSTLARVLAGRFEPMGGAIERPGRIGLGEVGGTAFVFQRPEAQVLGVRARDDVVWGLRDPDRVDVLAALERVGLAELADRETSTLSGGELQRLAVAAAIAREPQLLVSDEATSMVDAAGRPALVALLSDLARGGAGVVHVSHYPNEADAADRTIMLDRGRVVLEPPAAPEPRPHVTRGIGKPQTWKTPGALIELHGVGHIYSKGTPWANRALADVSLTINEGESVLVVGHNGSGKSTLAWIMAGLVVPSEGDALVDKQHACDHIGRVGLSFQHARLQLLRPIVVAEVAAAAGVEEPEARDAIAEVGLDAAIADRRVDELSGGQMRRVVLAAVLAARARAIVLDEPFAGLDADGRADLEALLIRLRDEHDIALVIVSHDYDLPPALVERVIELEAGRIVRDERVLKVREQ